MQEVDDREGHLDVLVDNAGIWDRLDGVEGLSAHLAAEQFATDATAVVAVTRAALPLLRRSRNPVVVNVSSGLGSFALVTDPASHQLGVHSVVCSATKAAVDMLTVRYARAVPEVRFNAVDPGRPATDLHGDLTAPSPEAGADVVARRAAADLDGPTGTFQSAEGEVPW